VLNFYTMRAKALGAMPWPVQILVGQLLYRKVTQKLQGQGTLLLSEDEIRTFREEIWERINGLLVATHAKHGDGDGPLWVWGGDAPTEADAVLFGFIVSGLVCTAYVSTFSFCSLFNEQLGCPLTGSSGPATRKIITGYPALVAYAKRIHDKYFPDYELQFGD
jgi:hypothetical protein